MEKNVVNILVGTPVEQAGVKIVGIIKKLLSQSQAVELNQIKLVLSIDEIDRYVQSNAYDIVICNEVMREGSIGGGTISRWKKANADIRIILIVAKEKKGALKISKLYDQGYYDAIFSDDLAKDPKCLARIIEKGRTREEAFAVYQIKEPETIPEPEPEPETVVESELSDAFSANDGAEDFDESYDEDPGEYDGGDDEYEEYEGDDSEEYGDEEYDESAGEYIEDEGEDSASDDGDFEFESVDEQFEQAFGNVFQPDTNTMQGGNVMQGNQNVGGKRRKMAANGDGYANMARGAGGRKMAEPGFQSNMGAAQPPVANTFYTPSILPHDGFISAVLSNNLVVIECPTGGFSPEMVGKKIHLLTPNS